MKSPLKTVLALSLVPLFMVGACSKNQSDDPGAPDNPTSSEASAPAQQWDKEKFISSNFHTAPYLVQDVQVNPQAYKPDNNSGVPLPKQAGSTDVVWQLPACVLLPYTGAGPTKSDIKDGHVSISGWDHTPEGAAAAGFALMNSAVDAKDKTAATADATGLSKDQVPRLLAENEAFATAKGGFTEDKSAQCSTKGSRPGGWKIIDYTDSSATIDYLVAVDKDKGISSRILLDWKDGKDWKLNPASFQSLDKIADAAKRTKGEGYPVNIEEFTQW